MIDNEKYSIILPARIVEYFPETQTATIQICAETIYSDSNDLAQVKTRAPLEGVPVHTSSGGGWSITFPIKVGDTCVIMFSQVGYDHWLYEDKDTAGLLANLPKPWLGRQFNEDDGFAFVGVNTLPKAITDYAVDDTEIRNADRSQRISLLADGSIHIKAGTTTVNVTSDGAIAIETDTSVDVTTGTDINLTSTGTTNVLSTGNTTIEAAEVAITSALVTMSGALEVTGSITGASAAITGAITGASAAITGAIGGATMAAGGIDLATHTHSTTISGGSSSGTYTSGAAT